MDPQKPSYIVVNNFRLPKGLEKEKFISGLSYSAKPGDIFVCSYPKCGTTWTQYIVYLILNDGNPLSETSKLEDFFKFLEYEGKEPAEDKSKPSLLKVHLPYHMTPMHPEAKYIYVVRNPKDCVVSFFHHTRAFDFYYNFANGKFDDYFELFINGEVDFGDYFDNLLSWYPHRNDPNVLFLTYESMKEDIRSAVLKIARFIGEKYETKLLTNESILEKVIKNSQFSEMKKDKDHWNYGIPDNMPGFIRKGEIGDWRNHFSEEQSKRLDEKMRMRTEGTDIMQLWSSGIM